LTVKKGAKNERTEERLHRLLGKNDKMLESDVSTRLDKATKAFELGIRTDSPGEREACRRGCLRLIARELGVTFDPDERVDPVEQWGLRVERTKIHVPVS